MATSASANPSINITYTLINVGGNETSTETASAGYSTSNWVNGSGSGNVNMGVILTGYILSGETVTFDFYQLPKLVWDAKMLLDFTSTVTDAGTAITYPNRGIKGMVITNTWNSNVLSAGASSIAHWNGIGLVDRTGIPNDQLPRLNVHATGTNTAVSGGFSGLFDGESGNISLNPRSSWSFSDTIGKTPTYDASDSIYNHVISITTENFTNISGSGGLSSGTSGDPVYYQIWNDFGDHVNAKGEPAVNPWSGNLPRMTYEMGVVGVVAPNQGCKTYTVCYNT